MDNFCNTAMSYLTVGQAYADSISRTIIQTATSQPAWVYLAVGAGGYFLYRKLKNSHTLNSVVQTLRIQRKLQKAKSHKPVKRVPLPGDTHASRSGPSNDSLANGNTVTEFKRNQEVERKRMQNL